jgi:riboflavin-specific deaminase-like protein
MLTPPSPASPALADDDSRRAAWQVLLSAAARARDDSGLNILNERAAAASLGIDATGAVAAQELSWLVGDAVSGWKVGPAAPPAARALLDLYAPVCSASARRPLAIAHLGQSLDGYIATGSGDSYYVTGPANVAHLHRLRALCDAVVVGAGTVARDDPWLTVRHVPGDNPTRVVIDPRRRLGADRRVFADDAATLVICAESAARDPGPRGTETIALPLRDGKLDPAEVIAALHARGLHSVFVEGGGATVSGFLEAGLLDRVQIAIAPLVTGSGRRGLSLPARDKIADCLRPSHRVFTMGGDVLFDCDLRGEPSPPSAAADDLARVV